MSTLNNCVNKIKAILQTYLPRTYINYDDLANKDLALALTALALTRAMLNLP